MHDELIDRAQQAGEHGYRAAWRLMMRGRAYEDLRRGLVRASVERANADEEAESTICAILDDRLDDLEVPVADVGAQAYLHAYEDAHALGLDDPDAAGRAAAGEAARDELRRLLDRLVRRAAAAARLAAFRDRRTRDLHRSYLAAYAFTPARRRTTRERRPRRRASVRRRVSSRGSPERPRPAADPARVA